MALEDYRNYVKRCARCSYCKWIPLAHVKSWRFAKGCPSVSYKNFQSYSAGGRVAVANSLLEGRIEYSDGLLDIVYQCLMDGSCDIADKTCRYYVEPLEIMRELRFKLVEDGQILPQHMPLIDSLRKEDNMVMGKRTDRGKWSEGLDVKDLTQEKAGVVFHGGCQIGFDEKLAEIGRTSINLMRSAGVDIGIFPGQAESCCAGRAYDIGYKGELAKFAESNMDAWKNAGVKTVVTACADCYWAFKSLYPQYGSTFEVLHVVEYIHRLIKEGKIKFSKEVPMTVTYHDPCHLGRLGEKYEPWDGKERKILGQLILFDPPRPQNNGANGIYDEPREILKAIPGIELIEMERIREYAWCCGAGGCVNEAYPEFSEYTARERIEEAKSTKAQALVTACTHCYDNFNQYVDGDDNLAVYDILELVKKAI